MNTKMKTGLWMTVASFVLSIAGTIVFTQGLHSEVEEI